MTEIPNTAANFFFLLQLNAHMLNTYTYHLLPPVSVTPSSGSPVHYLLKNYMPPAKHIVLATTAKILSSLYSQARGGAVVEALCYKPEGYRIDSQ
jgi:hypothetical protein